MLDPKILDDLAARMSALIAASPAKDLEKNAKALFASLFAKMDLVTREDFDVQSQVLARAREQLKLLEERVAELERQLRDAAE